MQEGHEESPAELHRRLRAVADFLRLHGRPEAAGVDQAAEEVYRGDPRGARRYVDLNRAILDIHFAPFDGNAPDDATGEALNERLRELHHAAYRSAALVERRFR